jgi:hypothetical protein
MRTDAAVIWPVFGGLCHQLIRMAGHVKYRPFLERPSSGVCFAGQCESIAWSFTAEPIS